VAHGRGTATARIFTLASTPVKKTATNAMRIDCLIDALSETGGSLGKQEESASFERRVAFRWSYSLETGSDLE